jgi:PAS domain S-box-containing protein
MSRDVTSAEARLRAILDSALDAVITTDSDSVITGWSAHAETMFGWRADEALGRTLAETIIPERYRGPHQAGVRHHLATGEGPILNERVEITALRRDGREFPVELTVAAARWDDEVTYSAFIRDVSDWRRAEARLAAEHGVTRALADAGTVEAGARLVLRAMGEALEWPVGYVWMVHAGRLRVAAHWNAEDADVEAFHEVSRGLAFRHGEGLPGRAWQTGEPVWITDMATESGFVRAPHAARAGLHAAIALPVRAGGQVLGVIEFFGREPGGADDALLDMARAIGSDVGQAFRRIHAEEERDRALAETRASNEMLRGLNAQLAARTEEAERANRAKSDFLAVMSHELRTPINAVLGYTSLMEMGIAGPVTAEQRGYLDRVRSSTTHLLGLINDVLDLSKIEAGRMGVVREPGRAEEAVSDAISFVATQAADKGLGLRTECESPAPTYLGDGDRVRQILLNLLSNAVKFTERGQVTVRCGTGRPAGAARLEGAGPWVCIRVEDTGPGIAPEETESVFEPFVQAESPHTRTTGGTGLGLSISRRLARMMDGDLTLETELGRGACFTLWLPPAGAAPVVPETPAAAPATAAPGDAAALRKAGQTLQHELRPIIQAYVARLRDDAELPARALNDAEVEDHQATLLTDIAQCLVALGDAPGEVSLLQDGTEVQRLLAFRHGEQRARQGWGDGGLRREFTVLGELMRRALEQGGVPASALEVLSRFLHRVEEISVAALCAALQTTGPDALPGEPPPDAPSSPQTS